MPDKPTPVERFNAKVQVVESGCWLWTAARTKAGYGCFKASRYNLVLAHRWSYEQHVGPVPSGLTLDHLCRTPACVNPEHLEPVTGAENTRRAMAAKTTCKAGHALTEENTWRGRAGGYVIRKCRTCDRLRKRAYRNKQRAA